MPATPANPPGCPPRVMAVGGSDPSAGAGIQADLRTLEMLGVQATTVVTAVTVQDGRRVRRRVAVAPGLVEAQLAAVLEAFPPAAVKCGLLPTAEIVRRVGRRLASCDLPVVVDPVLRASGGRRLAQGQAAAALASVLFPIATVVTFNLEEAEHFAGRSLASLEEAEQAARALAARGPGAVVIKGGHWPSRAPGAGATDVLWDGRRIHRLHGERIARGDLHGAGCAFASAAAAGLARGLPLVEAVRDAGSHVRELLERAEPIGEGVLLRKPPRG